MTYYRHPLSLLHNFGLLGNLANEVNRAFDQARTTSGYPKINAYANDTGLIIDAEVPGVDPKAIEISVEGNKLNITGEVPSRTKGENEIYHRSERSTGKFQRELTLPFNVDADGVNASYTNGILTLELSRREEDKPQKIEVNVT